MSDDWTQIKVSGSTVSVIGFGITGIACGLIWSILMMTPKSELRRSDYTAMRVIGIIGVITLGISIATAFTQIRRRFPDAEDRAARFKQAMLGLGGVAAAFALGLVSYALAAPGALAFLPTGLATVGMVALVRAMQASD